MLRKVPSDVGEACKAIAYGMTDPGRIQVNPIKIFLLPYRMFPWEGGVRDAIRALECEVGMASGA